MSLSGNLLYAFNVSRNDDEYLTIMIAGLLRALPCVLLLLSSATAQQIPLDADGEQLVGSSVGTLRRFAVNDRKTFKSLMRLAKVQLFLEL